MKLIQCIVQPDKFDVLLPALENVVKGMTVSEVRGFGRQKGHSVFYRGREYAIVLLPKLMIEIVAEDNRVDDIVKVVLEKAGSGRIGDGRIFILPVEENYHVRTGFMDLD